MTMKEFIKFLDTNIIDYHYENINGVDFVYVYGVKDCYIDSFTGKIKDYIPYLRVSHFDETNGFWYTRDNGICGYKSIDWILKRCKELNRIDLYEKYRGEA